MVKKLLFTFFLVFIQTTVFALNTYEGPADGDWNTAANWSLRTVPTASDDVVIPAGYIVTISSNSYAKSISTSGTLQVNDGLRLTVYNDLTVNSGGRFIMQTGSALGTLVVYGNYINNGLTDFWKSNVVIAGNLLSPTTSTIQKLGNVVVGGNIIGEFDTKGGTGDGQIYALDPNATVTITPSSIDNVVVPGTAVTISTETQALVDLVNLIIYGGNCTFSVDSIQNQTVCSGSNAVFTVSTSVSSPGYQWQVKTAAPGWSNLTDDATYSGVTTATLTISNVTDGMNNYQYRAKVSAGSPLCTRNGNSGVLTVNPLPVPPTIGACCSTTFCAGGSVTLTSSAASGNQWYNGGVLIDGATSTTYNATTSGTYTVITNNGTCSSLASAGTVVTVNALPVAPTASATLQPNCLIPTGTITVTAPTGAGITYSIDGSDYSNTTGSFNLVSVGDYNVTARNAGGCISAATLVSIIATSTTTWNSSSWDNGAPTLSKAAIIADNYDTASNPDIEACSLTINSGVTLTIRNIKFVTIQNHLTVNAGATLEIENQGSLVMINDAGNVTNNGTINVNKTTAPFDQYDYTYWSSPLKVTTSIATTFPTWRRAYEYHPENYLDLVTAKTGVAVADGFDDDGNDWIRISTMKTPGKGCIIMGPTTGSFPRTESVVFSGTVNNGVVSVPVLLSPGIIDAEDDFNLVGNPYPSAISADKFILANINTGGTINQTISGTLLFWTHVANASVTNPGPDAYNYTADDYAMYNLSGGVGVTGSPIPSGYIGSGQGFFVEAVGAGAVTFNNSMRVGDLPNTQFFKTQSVKDKAKAVNKDRFWLNFQNANGMFSQQLVGYFENATMGYDNGYDGLLSNAGNFVNFYSFIDDAAYKIQGREAFNADDQIRLGYFSSIAGTFNINIDSKEGVFSADETPIYLEDKTLGIIHDLKQSAYSFETEKGSFDDRFVLRYNNTDKTLGTDESKISENKIIVSVKERQLKINSFEEAIDKVWIYDLLGRQIYTKEKVDSSEFVISNLVSAKQTLIVKVLLQNGQIYTDKVVY